MAMSDYSDLEKEIGGAPEPKMLPAGSEVKARIISVRSGVSDKNDCDDKALQMVSDMASDGYIGGVAHDYTNYDTPHMLVCVPINNEVYFVEPTTKDISRELDGHWFVLD